MYAFLNTDHKRSSKRLINSFTSFRHQRQPLRWKRFKNINCEKHESPNTIGLMAHLILPNIIIKIQKIWAALRYITLTFSHKIWLCPVLKKQDFKSWRHNASRERELSLNHLQTRRYRRHSRALPTLLPHCTLPGES